MSPALHPLAQTYFDALYELPAALRARKAQEVELAKSLTSGHHVCLRGFWRSGLSTLQKGVLAAACERTGGAAFVVDLIDDDGVGPTSPEAALKRVGDGAREFLKRVGAAAEVKVDDARPLAALGELAAPLFVGVDGLLTLAAFADKAPAVFDALFALPKNVKLVLVAERHRDADALIEAAVLAREHVEAAHLRPISDDELVELVQTPAQTQGVTFENEALGELAALSGNRPWELLILCGLVASSLKPGFKGPVTAEQVVAAVSLDVLAENEEGSAMVENALRVLVAAMTPEERSVLEMTATGTEGEVPGDAVERLELSGFLDTTEGFVINGAVFEAIVRGVAEGEIRVSDA